MITKRLFTFFLLSLVGFMTNAANIEGQIKLNNDWAPVVYLSSISSFDDLQTATYHFLRYQCPIDSNGYFEFKNIDLVDQDQTYRLHICKKGDPVSTIIIGGKEENYIHFIMNGATELLLLPNENAPGIANSIISGHSTGASLKKLFDLQKKLNTPLDLPSEQNRSFIKQQVYDDLQASVDTASNPLVRLLAFHFITESFASRNHLKLMKDLDADLVKENHSSSYYKSFRKQLSYLEYQEVAVSNTSYAWLKWSGLLLLFFFIAFMIRQSTKRLSVKKQKDSQQMAHLLSNQEKRVLSLLKKGKTNKEISSELHIEVSTVKSHLHKIYSRLGVKSRKEIVNKEI